MTRNARATAGNPMGNGAGYCIPSSGSGGSTTPSGCISTGSSTGLSCQGTSTGSSSGNSGGSSNSFSATNNTPNIILNCTPTGTDGSTTCTVIPPAASSSSSTVAQQQQAANAAQQQITSSIQNALKSIQTSTSALIQQLSPSSASSNNIATGAAPTLSAAQGYDSATSSYETNPNIFSGGDDYLILWGNFSSSGNKVSINNQTLPANDVTYQSLHQINVFMTNGLDSVSFPVSVSNVNGSAASVTVNGGSPAAPAGNNGETGIGNASGGTGPTGGVPPSGSSGNSSSSCPITSADASVSSANYNGSTGILTIAGSGFGSLTCGNIVLVTNLSGAPSFFLPLTPISVTPTQITTEDGTLPSGSYQLKIVLAQNYNNETNAVQFTAVSNSTAASGASGGGTTAVGGSGATTYPTGCTSSSGYSTTTGLACSGPSSAFIVPGCVSSSGINSSIITGEPCNYATAVAEGSSACSPSVSSPSYQWTNKVCMAGCETASSQVLSPTTGLECDNSSPYLLGCTSHTGTSAITGVSCSGSPFSATPTIPQNYNSNTASVFVSIPVGTDATGDDHTSSGSIKVPQLTSLSVNSAAPGTNVTINGSNIYDANFDYQLEFFDSSGKLVMPQGFTSMTSTLLDLANDVYGVIDNASSGAITFTMPALHPGNYSVGLVTDPANPAYSVQTNILPITVLQGDGTYGATLPQIAFSNSTSGVPYDGVTSAFVKNNLDNSTGLGIPPPLYTPWYLNQGGTVSFTITNGQPVAPVFIQTTVCNDGNGGWTSICGANGDLSLGLSGGVVEKNGNGLMTQVGTTDSNGNFTWTSQPINTTASAVSFQVYVGPSWPREYAGETLIMKGTGN